MREYTAADQLSAVHLRFWTRDPEDGKRYRQDFTRDPRGRVSSIDAPYEWTNPRAKTSRTSYTHYVGSTEALSSCLTSRSSVVS